MQVGDLVECVCDEATDVVKKGQIYQVVDTYGKFTDFDLDSMSDVKCESFVYVKKEGKQNKIQSAIFAWRFKVDTNRMRTKKIERILGYDL